MHRMQGQIKDPIIQIMSRTFGLQRNGLLYTHYGDGRRTYNWSHGKEQALSPSPHNIQTESSLQLLRHTRKQTLICDITRNVPIMNSYRRQDNPKEDQNHLPRHGLDVSRSPYHSDCISPLLYNKPP